MRRAAPGAVPMCLSSQGLETAALCSSGDRVPTYGFSCHPQASETSPNLPSELRTRGPTCQHGAYPGGQQVNYVLPILSPTHYLSPALGPDPLQTHPLPPASPICGQYHHPTAPGHWALFSNFLHCHPTSNESACQFGLL